MVTLEMAQFGPVTSAWETARSNMAVSTSQQTGFNRQAECSGDIQSANNIGFWCDWQDSDGAVMMIGGGGSSCSGADHGIGITKAGTGRCFFRPQRAKGELNTILDIMLTDNPAISSIRIKSLDPVNVIDRKHSLLAS